MNLNFLRLKSTNSKSNIEFKTNFANLWTHLENIWNMIFSYDLWAIEHAGMREAADFSETHRDLEGWDDAFHEHTSPPTPLNLTVPVPVLNKQVHYWTTLPRFCMKLSLFIQSQEVQRKIIYFKGFFSEKKSLYRIFHISHLHDFFFLYLLFFFGKYFPHLVGEC